MFTHTCTSYGKSSTVTEVSYKRLNPEILLLPLTAILDLTMQSYGAETWIGSAGEAKVVSQVH